MGYPFSESTSSKSKETGWLIPEGRWMYFLIFSRRLHPKPTIVDDGPCEDEKKFEDMIPEVPEFLLSGIRGSWRKGENGPEQLVVDGLEPWEAL
ncbi:Protein CBG27495 [Caenorhabditis briggsae]|uniref:Protein CBG27495 n=1 Tax=Caenorhabditis briggsae TaxID=6238 RepID=B6IF10_CAEBR|nr:Protein CBG27495 [Caenorhabditis briggsae]CAR98490.1 Protein CBG27495 [Caenorhabditis briggsae]